MKLTIHISSFSSFFSCIFQVLFFLLPSHGIQADFTNDKMTSFNQLYLTNPLITSGRTPVMAGEAPTGNICVREISNSRPP